ncbi:MAG: ATP-binding protein [Oscillospiraceae bacterium]|nr:ATP-binding protein [Oscillospiraceae bacterium]
MPYDGKLLARARAQLDTIRRENQAEQQRRLAAVYARVPRIEQIDQQLRQQMMELVRLTVSRDPALRQKLEALKKDNLGLQADRLELLVEAGFPEDYLDNIYSCPHCRDTGVLDGRPCDCLDRLYNKELTRELGVLLRQGDESFDHFDLTLYSDQLDPAYGVIPRQAMTMIYEFCRSFAESFPQRYANLLLQGEPGLGKTYLSACIARVVAEKGYSVCYDTATSALDAFAQQKFSRDPEEADAAAARVRRMLDCDLMILDDLGTELVTPMALSALYTLIDQRLVNRKMTIISTNCTDEDRQKRYSPQICSRLDGEFVHLPFAGQDIRRMKFRR